MEFDKNCSAQCHLDKKINKSSFLNKEFRSPVSVFAGNCSNFSKLLIGSKLPFKGPSKNYVTARGGRGSTILLHIVSLRIFEGDGGIL